MGYDCFSQLVILYNVDTIGYNGVRSVKRTLEKKKNGAIDYGSLAENARSKKRGHEILLPVTCYRDAGSSAKHPFANSYTSSR